MGKFSEDKIILELNVVGYQVIDFTRDPKFKALKDAEAKGELPETKGHVTSPRAALFHKKGMLYHRVVYEDGTKETKIKPECIVAGPSDEKGRLFLDLDQVDLAREILVARRLVDKKAGVDPASALSEEEILPPPPPVQKGGRGKEKKIVRIEPC